MSSDARQDALTGVGSRLRLRRTSRRRARGSSATGMRTRVAMIGLEPGGDDAVRRAGAALGQEIRSGDVLYRHGAATFVVLLPEQALDTANLAAGPVPARRRARRERARR